jgi:predicted MFS family arabinose efflux permease
MAASTAVQFVFGVLARFLLDEFDIERYQLGLLTTASFVVGGLGSVPAGRLVDRVGGRPVQTASLVIICTSVVVMALAPSYLWMLVGAALAGGALATANPTTNKLIARDLEAGERGVIMGFKQAGVQAGNFLIGVSLPAAARAWGWRAALGATVVVPLATVAATLLLIPRDRGLASHDSRRPEARGSLEAGVWWLGAYALLMGTGVATFSGYVPLYAQESLGLSVGKAGLIAGTTGLVGILSRIAWGWGAERFGQFSKPLVWLALGAIAAIVLVLLAPAIGAAALWAGAVLFGATALTWNAIGMLAVLDEVDPQDAGQASGLVVTGFYVGFVVSPMLFGYSVDLTGTYSVGWGAVAAVFLVATLVATRWDRMKSRQRIREAGSG